MTSPIIVWLRQDLRLAAHPALCAAAAAGPVIALYVLDDETPGRWRWGGASRWWLHRSLDALARKLPLVLRRGAADRAIGALLEETGAAGVYFTRDYAPWSPALETRIKDICASRGVPCRRFGGFLLHEPEAVRTGAGEPYKVYTPFSRACFARGEPRPPPPAPEIARWSEPVAGDRLDDWNLLPARPNWAKGFDAAWRPGEDGARARLADFIAGGLAGYADGRDRPDRSSVSRLSPHLHWGEVSPAQCWIAVSSAMAEAMGRHDRAGRKFLQELLWREFSCHLLHHWPDLPEAPFRPEFAAFPWARDPAAFAAWTKGMTGYPIVDAGMRELWATGTMHNRVRMIAASFLIKNLLIPWQEGEAWFWDTLCDADIASNSASWQWVAGCGADAAPYFRIFNPVLQGARFDPEGAYVKRWLPELAGLAPAHVHTPWEAPAAALAQAGVALGETYPRPIADLVRTRARALDAFATLRRRA